MMPGMATIRELGTSDLAAVHHLEVEAYEPALHVSDAAFLRLIDLYPAGALGCFDGLGLRGYAFGVPVISGTILDLRQPLDGIAPAADVFYVHDLAVARRCRGSGTGRLLATRLLDGARAAGFRRAELVSVQGSAPFWEKFGFRATRAFEYVPGSPSLHMEAEL